jgi:asparagine synthase (glutamine-hydrolysing)
MPGVSLKCDFNKKVKEMDDLGDQLFLKASKSVLHNDYYKEEVLYKKHPYFVLCTKYPEYPVKILENNNVWVCMEGKIYGKSETVLNNEINEVADYMFNNVLTIEKNKKFIKDWLLESDGDFVLYALNKKNKDFFVMNDALGRLPLYYYVKNGAEIIVSREIQFISFLIQNTCENGNEFDMMGIAQFLLFSQTIGRRTLLNNVSRLEPASVLIVRDHNSKIETHKLHVFNFDNKLYANDSIKQNAQGLVPLILEACKNRANQNAKNIISLSGGLDSRAVAASLHENNIPFFAVTSPEPNWVPVVGSESETEIAEKLSKILSIELEKYDIMVPKAEHLLKLLKIKNGLVYLAHSFLPRFLEELKDKYGSSINFFTGHGGDVSFADLYFNFPDVESWVKSIIYRRGQLPLQIVAALTKIDETEIMDELKNILSSYPEEDLSLKNVHFLFFEDNANFSFEIEDVNRIYFWTVAPFYSVPFFKYIFNCPDKNKEKLALYREFLFSISPSIAAVNISNWGCSILSMKFKILQYILYLSFRHRRIGTFLKKKYDKRAYSYNDGSKIIQCIKEQARDCNQIANYLSSDIIDKILNNCTHYKHEGIDNLLTITSLIERSLCNRSTISKYY